MTTIQICLSLLFLGLTTIFYINWYQKNPQHELLTVIVLILGMLGADILTYSIDFILVIKRWKAMLFFRHIACTLSLVMGIIIQADFYAFNRKESGIDLNFGNSKQRWIMLIIFYMYESYIGWAVMNTLMYF